MMPAGMSELLERKYMILQQHADANSEQARATTTSAGTNAMVGKSAANLDNVRAGLLPAESAANIGLTRANTGLIGQQAKYFGPESMARVANLRADGQRTVVGTANDYNMGVLSFKGTLSERDAGIKRYQGFRLGAGLGQ